jgi:hypothetical protein
MLTPSSSLFLAAQPDALPSGSVHVVFFDLQKIVQTAQAMADTVWDFSIMIAFVLMVFGAIQGFLHADQRRFFATLLRLTIVVSLISGTKIWKGWLHDAVQGIANNTVSINMQLTNPAQTVTFTSTMRPDIGMIEQVLKAKYPDPTARVTPANSQNSQNSAWWDVSGWYQKIVNEADQQLKKFNIFEWGMWIVRNIILSILVLFFRLCVWVVYLMTMLQQVVIIFLSIYVPIALAELSIHSLRNQGLSFLKTLVGAHCWPIGWVFVNIITVAMLDGLPQPDPMNLGSILLCLIYIIPIFLWTLIGHFLAPFYAQKIVVHGGVALQGFTGAMLAVTGQMTGAVYGAIAAGATGALAGAKSPASRTSRHANWNPEVTGPNSISGQQDCALPLAAGRSADGGRKGFPPFFDQCGGGGTRKQSSSAKAAQLIGNAFNGAENLVTSGVNAAGQLATTAGNVAGTLGALTAEGARESVGNARGFLYASPKIRTTRSWSDSSSRARRYLSDDEYS